MTICMNMSRFINLAAIFSLDLESQCMKCGASIHIQPTHTDCINGYTKGVHVTKYGNISTVWLLAPMAPCGSGPFELWLLVTTAPHGQASW